MALCRRRSPLQNTTAGTDGAVPALCARLHCTKGVWGGGQEGETARRQAEQPITQFMN